MGWVKANGDVAIFQNQGRIGTGCIVRDSAVAMIMAHTLNIMRAYLIREAEVTSLKEALTWLKRKQVDKCIIETNSTQVIVALNDNPKQSLFHLIIDDCKHLLRSFRQVQVRFIRRSMNGVARVLAEAARSLLGPKEWLLFPPNLISHVMLVDCSH